MIRSRMIAGAKTRALLALGFLAAGVASSCSGVTPAPEPADQITYEYAMYVPGLDENVRIVKTLRHVRAHLDDGRIVGESELWMLESAARRAKFGAMTPEFAAGVRSAAPDRAVEVGFFFQIDSLPADLLPALHLSSDYRPSDAQAAVQAAVTRSRGPAESMLRSSGVAVEHTYDTIPLILGRATPAVLEKVARSSMMTVIAGAGPSRADLHAAKNGVSDALIDTTFNKKKHWGAGQKIAHIEDQAAGLYDNHEAFSQAEVDPRPGFNNNRVTYQQEPADCVVDTDCVQATPMSCPNGQGSNGVVCIALGHPGHAKQCVTKHAS